MNSETISRISFR